MLNSKSVGGGWVGGRGGGEEAIEKRGDGQEPPKIDHTCILY